MGMQKCVFSQKCTLVVGEPAAPLVGESVGLVYQLEIEWGIELGIELTLRVPQWVGAQEGNNRTPCPQSTTQLATP